MEKLRKGFTIIDGKNSNSSYHKNLGISYPNRLQIERMLARFNKSPGGNIKIHGWPNGYSKEDAKFLAPDWTIGCIAISNEEIDELYMKLRRRILRF
jgi:murein L,D-transpeptidase YafK